MWAQKVPCFSSKCPLDCSFPSSSVLPTFLRFFFPSVASLSLSVMAAGNGQCTSNRLGSTLSPGSILHVPLEVSLVLKMLHHPGRATAVPLPLRGCESGNPSGSVMEGDGYLTPQSPPCPLLHFHVFPKRGGDRRDPAVITYP